MLYTEDFTMRHYVGFSQIGSHILHFLFGNVAKWFGPVQHDEYTGDKWC